MKNIQVPAVEVINDPVDFILFYIIEIIFLRKPAFSITPPKIIAQITNHMVSNIPNIPLDERSLETISLDASIDIDPYKEIIVPQNNAFQEFELESEFEV